MVVMLFENLHEPSLTMNSILAYIVKELKQLSEDGIKIGAETYYVELFNISADDPGEAHASYCRLFLLL